MIRYVTRWALTTGIRRVEGEYTSGGQYFSGADRAAGLFVFAREAFESEEAAQDRAREMARAKRKNLLLQAEKLGSPTWRAKVQDLVLSKGAT